MAFTRLARVFNALFRASSEYSSSIFEGVLYFLCIYRKCFDLLNDDTLNALLITNKFHKKEKLLENEKDLAKQKLSSKPAKAAETTETVEAALQKSLTQNRQNIPRSSRQNDKSKIAKPPILGFFDILQFEMSSWIFFLVCTGKKCQFEISSLTFILNL